MEPEYSPTQQTTQETPRKEAGKSLLIPLSVLLGIGMVLLAAFLLIHKGHQYPPASSSPSPVPVKTIVNGVPTKVQVQITATGLNPQTVLISKGSTVTWVNTDTRPHSLALDAKNSTVPLEGFATPLPLSPRDSFAFTFNTLGNFRYQDTAASFLSQGTILVR